MEDKISIIVPVYNQEAYVEKCLYSIKKQSYQNIEVIIVDDGSTDTSLEKCKEICKEDDRFRVYIQENKGLSAARNKGMEYVSGKYICFIDSDDFISESYIKSLYTNIVQHDADISIGNYKKIYDDQDAVSNNDNWNVKEMSRLDVINNMCTVGPDNKSEPMVVMWNKLIKRDILKGLRFRDGFHEDEFMMNELLMRAVKYVWSDEVLYFYRQHDLSIMGDKNKENIKHIDALMAYEKRLELFAEIADQKLYKKIVESYFDNVIICYLLHYTEKYKTVWNTYVYRIMYLNFWKYLRFLSFKKSWHIVQFMYSPKYYKKRYW